MSTPVRVLLMFAGWTLVPLVGGVLGYRLMAVVRGRRTVSDFSARDPTGPAWYRRASRAHMNCVENLPVYGALVLVIVASGARGPWLDTLALVFLSARLLQTVTHVGFRLTDLTVTVRFGFFLVQLLCMVWMGGLVVLHTGGA